jgi:hypothetical protein
VVKRDALLCKGSFEAFREVATRKVGSRQVDADMLERNAAAQPTADIARNGTVTLTVRRLDCAIFRHDPSRS